MSSSFSMVRWSSERHTTSALCTKASKALFVEARPLIEMLNRNPLIGLKMMSIVAGAYVSRYQSLVERVQKALADPTIEQ